MLGLASQEGDTQHTWPTSSAFLYFRFVLLSLVFWARMCVQMYRSIETCFGISKISRQFYVTFKIWHKIAWREEIAKNIQIELVKFTSAWCKKNATKKGLKDSYELQCCTDNNAFDAFTYCRLSLLAIEYDNALVFTNFHLMMSSTILAVDIFTNLSW